MPPMQCDGDIMADSMPFVMHVASMQQEFDDALAEPDDLGRIWQ